MKKKRLCAILLHMKKIELSYQKNVRDLGGYVGFNGKKVKEGRLYRGGFLGRVSNDDIKTINALKLTDIVDFRSEVEYVSRPDYQFLGVKYHNFPTFVNNEELKKRNDYDDSNLLWFLGDSTDGVKHMVDIYIESLLTKTGIEAYKNFFKVLLSDNHRVTYYHCSQGKDRAGIGSYLILRALGVSEEDAFKDYLDSNEAMKIKIKQLKAMLRNKPFYNKEYEKALEQVFTADRFYLESALNELKAKYGDIENYLTNVLEVDLDRFRELYLED